MFGCFPSVPYLALLFFFVAAYLTWRDEYQKRLAAEGHHGGPEVFLRYELPKGLAGVVGVNTRGFALENTSEIDAYNLRIQDICLAEGSPCARFAIVPKVQAHSKQALSFGAVNFPLNYEHDFTMVYLGLKEESAAKNVIRTDNKGTRYFSFPIRVQFEDYGGSKFISEFEFTESEMAEKSSVRFIRRTQP